MKERDNYSESLLKPLESEVSWIIEIEDIMRKHRCVDFDLKPVDAKPVIIKSFFLTGVSITPNGHEIEGIIKAVE